jgi:hypothetical protein
MLRSLAAAVLAAAAAASHAPAPRIALLGEHTTAGVRAARAGAHAALLSAAAAAANAAPARLSARALTEHAPPSGLVEVRVEWEAAGWSPRANEDAVAVHCSPDAEAWDVADFFVVPAGEASGARTLVLPHGTGCDFSFAYIRGGAALFAGSTSDAAPWYVAGTARSVRLGDDRDPVGARLALGDAAGDILLTWGSMDGTAAAVVHVGTTRGGPYTLSFRSTDARTYRADDMCHAPASEASPVGYVFPGFIHTVALNLSTSTRYYAVYGQENGTLAPETSFRTRPQPGPDVFTRFAAFGDAATYPVYPGTVTTVANIVALAAATEDDGGVDFVTNIGDLAYAEGGVLLWVFWTGLMWPLTAQLPFMVTVGNHETNVDPAKGCASNNSIAKMAEWMGPVPETNSYGDDSGGEAAVATFERYRGPSSGLGVLWYSFDSGSVHFVLWSSEHDYRPGSAQYAWLRQDLLGVDRSVTPWVVCGMHRPMYNARSDGDYTIDVGMVSFVEALFVEAKVDLAISGHYHLYERTHSMRNFTVDPTGASPVYITSGTGGATYHNESIRPDSMKWTAFDDSEWGFTVVEAFNRSALRVTFRPNVGDYILDESWIMRAGR